MKVGHQKEGKKYGKNFRSWAEYAPESHKLNRHQNR